MKKIFIILITIFLTNFTFSQEISKCGTQFKKEMRKKKLRVYSANYLPLPRDYGLDKSHQTEHFILWYTTSGKNAVPTTDSDSDGTPDYIEDSAKYFEESYNYEVNTLGYLPPPTTSKYAKIYVYFIDMVYFGWTDYGKYPDDPSGENTLIAIHKNMSFVPNNDDPEGKVKGALKVTIAHELFHAVKASYDWEDELWWDEATSTWMEDEVYDYVNDYIRYLPRWFSSPQTPLDITNGWHEYGSVIFAKYLSENYTIDIIKEIWERCAKSGIDAKTAISQELTERGTDFSDCFKNFTVANYLKLYKEGSRYPDIGIKLNSETPYIYSSDNSISNLSSNYIVVPAIFKNNSYILPCKFQGENFKVMAIGINSEKKILREIPLNQSQKLENYEKIVFVISNSSFFSNYSYSYSTGFGTSSGITKPPSNLEVVYSGGIIKLTWKKAEGNVSGYNIYRSLFEEKNYRLIATVDANTTTYEDKDIMKAKTYGTISYWYFVTALDSNGDESLPTEKKWKNITTEFKIDKCYNYPNPAKDSTNFVCEFVSSPYFSVRIEIYNISGRKIKSQYIEKEKINILSDNKISIFDFSVKELSNGVYFYRIIFETSFGNIISRTGKLVVLK